VEQKTQDLDMESYSYRPCSSCPRTRSGTWTDSQKRVGRALLTPRRKIDTLAYSSESSSYTFPSSTFQQLQDLQEQYHLPSIAVGQTGGDEFVIIVRGVRKVGAAPFIKKDDTFHLGSLTKAMTATLLASFIKEGIFSWNTTIAEALPEISSEISPGHLNTTLAMLTSHHSGINSTSVVLNETFYNSLYNVSSPSDGRLEFARRALSLPPTTSPNSTWFYDNANYIIAGLIIDLRTSASWESQIQSRLFDALNMTGCGLGPNPESSDTSIDSPWPHVLNTSSKKPQPFDQPRWKRDNPPTYGPAGTVHCPLASYRHFLQLHIDATFSNTSSWYNLTASDFDFLHTVYQPGTPEANYTPGGFWKTSADVWEHNGSNNLNAAHVYLQIGRTKRESSLGMVMTNMGQGNTDLAVQAGIKRLRQGDINVFVD
jgi:CubicO group peptidase (beta-lactamase class C family)